MFLITIELHHLLAYISSLTSFEPLPSAFTLQLVVFFFFIANTYNNMYTHMYVYVFILLLWAVIHCESLSVLACPPMWHCSSPVCVTVSERDHFIAAFLVVWLLHSCCPLFFCGPGAIDAGTVMQMWPEGLGFLQSVNLKIVVRYICGFLCWSLFASLMRSGIMLICGYKDKAYQSGSEDRFLKSMTSLVPRSWLI